MPEQKFVAYGPNFDVRLLVVLMMITQERTRFVLILRDRDNFIILSRIKIKTIIKFPQIIKSF